MEQDVNSCRNTLVNSYIERLTCRRPDRSGGLPRLSLLRTVRATFIAYGSSTLKVTRLPGKTKSGSLAHGISSQVVINPLCTIWVSFTIDKYMSFDVSIRGMFK